MDWEILKHPRSFEIVPINYFNIVLKMMKSILTPPTTNSYFRAACCIPHPVEPFENNFSDA